MKKSIATILLCSAMFGSTSWAQTASEPMTNDASSGHTDPIVKMRQQIAAANKEYNRKVAAAKKVYESEKAAAAKVRDHAIAAARGG
ncbi:hypothetical protein [Pararobbsia alpina]|uniref:Uncharacterized protein n=1 Tax=Pararobbsia alpina TaxID=621374 RepID=A0A6S7BJG8_9BURK|nr:hypothetical protein [Pararobbsia alpina]CAB3793310.1 hypothetical protein LMG28138_03505 [Pararobbsia alpina]